MTLKNSKSKKLKVNFSIINTQNYEVLITMLKNKGFKYTFKKCVDLLAPVQLNEVADLKCIVDYYTKVSKTKGSYTYPCSDNPTVTIIIPAYNHFELTTACICSIIDSDLSVPTELIVADDCSTDETSILSEYIPGVRVIRTSNNMGFTLNCNNAAKKARGKYLLFLNNDTIVLKNWLQPLVDLIESEDNIGMVGSKLLYPDGSLQEAGGILWKDGSAWNYGNGHSPFDPEYNYVRDVDYISGAAILVRKDLFDNIGGFDRRYAPAYCEDSDLAFEIRRLGYRVVYQPFSEVIHFEGMSNGKRVDAGLKQYQIVNKDKFYDKWKDVLENEHELCGENVFQARERSEGKTTILFIDDAIPRYDENAGHRTVYDYLITLVSMGYNVKFIPDNFIFDKKYALIYQKMGIEVLYGPKYRRNIESWISENGGYFDYVMIYRPKLMEKYLSILKTKTSAKIYYNVADLHYLRLQREYEVTGDKNRLAESVKMREKELKLMHEADYTVTVSSEEAKIISREIGEKRTKLFPIFTFDKLDPEVRDYESAKDLMFVGNYQHRPNEDAVVWFVNEILPKVIKEVPDVRFNVIGSNVTKELQKLESKHVVIRGQVSDDELRDQYHNVAVCVVPLRYGAGVKGKIVEALHMNVPIVSTSVGLEGLPGIAEYINSFDESVEFANEVLRLYKNRKAAALESEKYAEYIQNNYSRNHLKEIFYSEFGPANKHIS